MPYIKPEERCSWDSFLQPILATVGESYNNIKPGELNYLFSSIVWSIFEANPSYTKANELIGVLECVKQEFIRRKLNPLEDLKIKENGDI